MFNHNNNKKPVRTIEKRTRIVRNSNLYAIGMLRIA